MQVAQNTWIIQLCRRIVERQLVNAFLPEMQNTQSQRNFIVQTKPATPFG